ncbi:MAG: FctA domain-containing protein [Eubacterium sp.]|nr:FctA domain-containing protein [Eubacterium sp.]
MMRRVESLGRGKTMVALSFAVFMVMVVVFSMFSSVGLAAEKTIDTSSMDDWQKTTADNTRNIGRVWVDKSVSTQDVTLPGGNEPQVTMNADDDFLVTLSALSSAATVTGESATYEPLDIVLVLDTSGSMASAMGSGTYYEKVWDTDDTWEQVWNRGNRDNLYVRLSDGQYRRLVISRGFNRKYTAYYRVNREDVYIAQDVSGDAKISQILYVSRSNMTRMDALRTAASNFIDATSDMNAKITGAENKHRVSLVTYASDAYIRYSLTTCEGSDADSIKNTIGGLYANGSTGADYAMEKTQKALGNARSDAQKVVIFFTDGEPNHYTGFDEDVANAAIGKAKEMKAEDTLIYSIGVFQSANPENTGQGGNEEQNNFNGYMHAMSSNYPDATSYTHQSLGERAQIDGQDSQYYKAATDPEGLDTIFSDIASELSERPATSPTEIQQGMQPDETGYITFNDQLGDYMKVNDFNAIVFADNVYEKTEKTTSGNTDRYIFRYEVSGNVVYPNGNLEDIVITVEKSEDLQTGDKVTVKIPASLIPLRSYDVDIDPTTGSATTEISDTYPIRIFYGAGLKKGVEEALENPDETLQAYIDANKTSDGKVSFYANAFEGEEAGVTVDYTPASTNEFYYFDKDTALYTDEGCTQRATEIDSNTAYYYQRTYYEAGEAKAPLTRVVEIPKDSNEVLSGFVKNDAEGLYIPKGTPRITGLYEYGQKKTDNMTATAGYVYKPSWSSLDTTMAPGETRNVIARLGNNGRLDADLPGELTVSKTVAAEQGHTAPAEDSFTFTLDLTAPSGTTLKDRYNAQVFDADGKAVGPAFTLADKGTFTLKDGETLRVYGLAAGTGYTVTETAKAHYTTTQTGETGTIASGTTSSAAFTNTYKAEAVTVGGTDHFKAAKTYNGWDSTSERFEFVLQAQGSAPLPEGSAANEKTAEVTRDNASNVDFGAITYTAPGTYTYDIFERTPENETPGVTYSDAAYRVVVTVTDNNGKLEASSTMTKTVNDDGTSVNNPQPLPDNAKTAEITNSFDAQAANVSPLATKQYTDHTGNKPLVDEAFTFCIERDDTSVPFPEAAGDALTWEVKNIGDTIAFGQIHFTAADNGKTYDYKISEVMPAEANEGNNYTVNGISYDPTSYYVRLAVSVQEVQGEDMVVVTTTYHRDDASKTQLTAEALDQNGRVAFKNSYQAAAVTLSGDTALKGTKTITGRDMKQGESYKFRLSLAEAKDISGSDIKDSVTMANTEATVQGAAQGIPADFSFGDITFAKAGTYTFNIVEAALPQDGKGMTYDRHTAKAVVTVTDNNGQLEASVVYDGDTGKTVAAFENVYKASMDYGTDGGFAVAKTLTGRGMANGEFNFTIAKAADADPKTPDLSAEDAAFTNPSRAAGAAAEMKKLSLSFTQADAGKTYSYIVDEAEGNTPGITYDQSQYRVDIAVSDNGDGTMHTVTQVTRIVDKAGNAVTEKLGTYNSGDAEKPVVSFENSYTAGAVTLDTSVGASLNKVLSGRDWTKNDSFNFNVTKVSYNGSTDQAALDTMPKPNSPITVSNENGKDGEPIAFSLGRLTFSKAGTYVYQVREDKADTVENGLTYSDYTAVLTISVTDDGSGQLKASASVAGSRDFVNTYTSAMPEDQTAKTKVTFTKTLAGRDWTDADSFTFKLTAEDNAPLPKNAQGEDVTKVTVGKPESGNEAAFSFGEIAFTYDMIKDAPNKTKTFVYSVSEDTGDNAGITYDTHTAKAEITVKDNGDGTMSATANVMDSSFTNIYKAEVNYVAAGDFNITKVLNGRAMTYGQFTFNLTPADKASASKFNIPEVGVGLPSLEAADGETTVIQAFLGKNIVFTQKDVGQIYSFTVTESNDGKAGYTYDDTTYRVKIETADDGQGKLTVTTTVSDGSADTAYTYVTGETPAQTAAAAFTNSYHAEGTLGGEGNASIEATKTLTGRDLIAGEFDFNIIDAKDNIVSAGTNDADGRITFSPITYTTEGLKQAVKAGTATLKDNVYSFAYTAVEDTTLLPMGVSATEDLFAFTVEVKDNGDGTLGIEVKAPEGGIAFENTYSAGGPISFIPKGTKRLAAAEGLTAPDITGKFTFTLYNNETGEVIDTTTNDEHGNVVFDALSFDLDMLEGAETAEDGSRRRTFVYRVEESGEVPGITNDSQNVSYIYLTLIDDGIGEITVWTDGGYTGHFSFTNTYSVTPTTSSVSEDLDITKVLTGRDMQEGEFSFVLKDAGNAVVAEGTNGADGSIGLSGIEFDKPGTYSYTLSETAGEAGGVDYDGTVYEVRAVVTDNSDGTLSVAWETEGETIVFNNSYKAEATSVVLGASKVLEGRDLSADEFTFVLKDEQGEVVSEASNDAEGNISFEPVEFTEAGSYSYTISEVTGKDKTITYDTKEYSVTITVTDDLEGHLTATVDNGDETPVFTNKYTAPAAPQKEETKVITNIVTGIGGSGGMISVGVVLAAVTALGITAIVRKKRA